MADRRKHELPGMQVAIKIVNGRLWTTSNISDPMLCSKTTPREGGGGGDAMLKAYSNKCSPPRRSLETQTNTLRRSCP